MDGDIQEIRTHAETYYDFEEDDMAQEAEVTFELGGESYRRTQAGYCYRDGRRIPSGEFDEARGRHLEEVGRRLAAVAGSVREAKGAKGPRPARRRRSKDVALEVEFGGDPVTITARQREFLEAAAQCPCWTEGDGTLWTDVLMDEMGASGMSFGAMVSTLREKGVIRVEADEREATGRRRRCKSVALTDRGRAVVAAAGLPVPGV